MGIALKGERDCGVGVVRSQEGREEPQEGLAGRSWKQGSCGHTLLPESGLRGTRSRWGR